MRPSTNIEDVREKVKSPQDRVASGFGAMDPANMTPKGTSYGSSGFQPADNGEGYTDDSKAGIPQGYAEGGTVKPRSVGDMRRARQVRTGSEIRPVRSTAPQAINNVRGFAAGGYASIVPNTSGSATTTSDPATGGGYTGNPTTQPSATQAPVGPDQNQYGSWGAGTGEDGPQSSTGNISATPTSIPSSSASGIPTSEGAAAVGGGYTSGGPFAGTGGIDTSNGTLGVAYAEGGDVPDPGGAIPDPENSDDMQDTSTGDPGQAGDPSQTADQGDLMGSVMDALTAARQQYGLTDQMFAGNISTVPAGPGGDQTQGGPQDRGNQVVADNSNSPRQIAPAPGAPMPAQGTLPNAPMNPRDYLPGGSKASDSGAIPTDENEAA